MRSYRIDRLVAPWAKQTPGQVAVDGGAEAMSYAQLDALANRFANLFKAAGVAPGDRVGVHVPRSARTIAAMLGASRAGAVYVPLDPSSPPARMKIIVADCGLRHVVITPELLASWSASAVEGIEHFFLSSEGPAASTPGQTHAWSEVLSASAEPVVPASDNPDDLAYLLYTSGSTGMPKGVMLSHRNALAFTSWAAELIALGSQDHVASVAPFHFDLSVFDVWATLSAGATLVIVDEATVLSGPRTLDRIRDKAISVWYSVLWSMVRS